MSGDSQKTTAQKLSEWAIKKQINFIEKRYESARTIHNRILIGIAALSPAILIALYKFGITYGISETDSGVKISTSISTISLLSPILVLSVFLLYFSEQIALYRTARYLDEQYKTLFATKIESWEEWLRKDRQKSKYKNVELYNNRKSTGAYLLFAFYYVITIAFSISSLGRIITDISPNKAYFRDNIVVITVFIFIIYLYIAFKSIRLTYTRSDIPEYLREHIVGKRAE